MRAGTRTAVPLLLALAFALTGPSGCSWRISPPEKDPPPPVVSVPAQPPAASKQKAPPAPHPAAPGPSSYESGKIALQEGRFERALELFCAAMKEKPGNPEITRQFDEALAGLKNQGITAYSQGKPEAAGKRWMGTLHFIDIAAARGRTHPSTRAEVEAHLDRLTGQQMEKGLLNYRKGDLPAAIAAWKTILAYDPGNEEAARAVRTASIQLENLRKIPSVQ